MLNNTTYIGEGFPFIGVANEDIIVNDVPVGKGYIFTEDGTTYSPTDNYMYQKLT